MTIFQFEKNPGKQIKILTEDKNEKSRIYRFYKRTVSPKETNAQATMS